MKKTIVAAALLAACASAQAQKAPLPPFYVVGGIGIAQHDIDTGSISRQLVELGYAGASTSANNDETAWRVGAGWQPHRHLGVEVSYFDLGKPSFSSKATRPGSFDASIKVTGWALDLLPQYAFDNGFAVFGRIGYARTESSADFSGSGAFRLQQTSVDKTHDGWNAGLGVAYAINRNFGIRGEWTYVPDVGDDTMGGRWDANVFGISAVWRF